MITFTNSTSRVIAMDITKMSMADIFSIACHKRELYGNIAVLTTWL